MGVCCCLQICNSVVNIVVIGLVLGQSLMVISILENEKFFELKSRGYRDCIERKETR